MRAHTNLLNAILASAPASVRLFRNDNGTATLQDGSFLRYGLLPGSGDLVGFSTVRGLAIFTSIEAKTGKDRVRPKQVQWAKVVREMGGIALVCRSVEECWSEHRKAVAEVNARTLDFTPTP